MTRSPTKTEETSRRKLVAQVETIKPSPRILRTRRQPTVESAVDLTEEATAEEEKAETGGLVSLPPPLEEARGYLT